MKFITVTIENNKSDQYDRMCDALKNSIDKNCLGARLQQNTLSDYQSPLLSDHHRVYIEHTAKLQCWTELLKSEFGNVCFIDSDTVVLKDVNHVFDQDFDIAYTKRSEGISLPINSGVLFVKANERSRRFFNAWNGINFKMMYDLDLHAKWHAKYAGINQASLGCLLESKAYDAKVIELPCAKYNACDMPDWMGIGEETHILHIKSQLRQACFGTVEHPELAAALNIWKGYDGKN